MFIGETFLNTDILNPEFQMDGFPTFRTDCTNRFCESVFVCM